MFLAIIFIAIGVVLLLNALGIISGNFWGIFLAIVFIAIGLKMLYRRGRCPVCQSYWWSSKVQHHIHNHQNQKDNQS